MAGKIELTDENGNTVTYCIKGNRVKGYVIRDGHIHKKPGYEEEDNNVIVPKQEPKESIFYKFQQFIGELLNK